MARARLRDRHQENLKRKLELLKAEQGFEDCEPSTSESRPANVKSEPKDEVEERDEEMPGPRYVSKSIVPQPRARGFLSKSRAVLFCSTSAQAQEIADSVDEYNAALYSPQYVSMDSLEPGTIIVTEEDDLSRLKFAREQVQKSGSRVEVRIAPSSLLQISQIFIREK